MKTNIEKLMLLYGMQSHTAKNIEDDFNYLPHGYSTKIVEAMLSKGKEVTASWVRHIRNFNYKDLEILNLLIELAKETKAFAEAEKAKFKEITS